MGGSGESSAQRYERTTAQAAADKTAGIADKEKETALKEEEAEVAKRKSYEKRKRGMQGGSREGLMYKGSNVGVQS